MTWLGEGILEKKNHTVYYSCEKKHIFGTGFLLRKRIKHQVIDFVPRSSRFCKIKLRGRFFNYNSTINAHAPTGENDEEEKELFYEDLHILYRICPRHDVKIILGDMNSKIGSEDEFIPTIGKHSLHQSTNDNRQHLIYFNNENGMKISSTFFLS